MPLAALAMSSRGPGLLAGAAEVARVELRELRSQPGLYLFVPMILHAGLGSLVERRGVRHRPAQHAGPARRAAMNTLTLLVCLLLLFYTVESLQRERGTGLRRHPPRHAAAHRLPPARQGAGQQPWWALIVLLAALTACVVILRPGQGAVPPRAVPAVWGVLLLPTFLVWTAFVTAVFVVTRSRYATYAVWPWRAWR